MEVLINRFNKGILYTNQNCVACNKCIMDCCVPGANIAINKNGKSRVEVSSSKCISCGYCLDSCSHNARHYKDDTERFFDDLKNGQKISLIVSPVFLVLHEKIANKVFGYLKSIGVNRIYDGSFGAEISVWAHVKYINSARKNNSNKKFIAQHCPAVVNFAQQVCPDLLDCMIPVHTPTMCSAIHIKDYLKDDSKLAVLSPCVTQIDEVREFSDYLSYNITFEKLLDYLSDVDFSSFNEVPELTSIGFGKFVFMSGGIKDCARMFLPPQGLLLNYESLNLHVNKLFSSINSMSQNNFQPLLLDSVACNFGCYYGSGVNKKKNDFVKIFAKLQNHSKELHSEIYYSTDYESNFKKLDEKLKNNEFNSFLREYTDLYNQPAKIPEQLYDDIFNLMHKTTAEKKNLNCRSCGYESCKSFVESVAYGYNRIENCIHYLNAEMQQRLYTDLQTGIPNRMFFERKLKTLLSDHPEIEYVAVVGDINRLGNINDLYGFEKGSKVIKLVAEKLCELAKDGGICARFGGGTFALCIPYTVERLNELHSIRYFDFSDLGIEFPVTMRFGLCSFDVDREDYVKCVNLAVFVMNKIKDRMRNVYRFYTEEIEDNLKQESEITLSMRKAMEEDEFSLFFQPQCELHNKKLVGAEVLSRWIKKDGSLISPAIFIPIFEKNGFICEFDKFVWENTFKIIRKWLDENRTIVPISVNVSRMSLESDAIIGILTNLQKKYNVPYEYIHFEITESAVMDDKTQLIQRVSKIRELGFDIAMDDFGSGYSSLNTLKDIPIDVLKLDMDFLSGNLKNRKSDNILTSVIRMAQSLNLYTIAEGVETEEQANYLKNIGCNIIQGFYYSKPICQKEFEHFMEVNQKSVMKRQEIVSKIYLTESEYKLTKQLKLLVEKSPVSICLFRLKFSKGKVDTALVKTNEQFLTFSGYSREEVMNWSFKDWIAVIHPLDIPGFCMKFVKALKNEFKDTASYLYRAKAKDGHYVWVKIMSSGIKENDEEYWIAASFLDYTNNAKS